MDESDGGASSGTPGSNRQCLHCNKVFQIVHKGHRCCSTECTKARHALNRQSASAASANTGKEQKSNKRKKDVQPADATGTKKSKNDPVSTFLAGQNAADIQQLSQAELVERLISAISLLENQRDDVLELEAKFSRLQDDIDEQASQIRSLEEEAVQSKIFFADTVLKLQCHKTSVPSLAGQSYASVARGNITSSVLVAKCIDSTSSPEPLNVQAVEELLDTPNSGVIPSHVRFKNNKMFVTLDNEVAVAKAAAILNNKSEFHSRFEPASKLNMSYPVVALFVNISDLDSLKKELEHRNLILRGQIQSIKVIFTKPKTTEGHVKIFLKSKAAREDILAQRRASIFGTYYRVVPVDLNREVRRCFNCQRYGHLQRDCKADLVACGKCAEHHRTSECVSKVWKCVNCSCPHQTGDKLCSEQVKAVNRYRAFLESNDL